MDVDRLSTGEKVAGVSAVLLFIFMFFDWFSVDVSASTGGFAVSASEGGSAWQAFSVIDLILLLTVVVVVAVVVIRLSDALVEPPVSLNAVAAVMGGLSVVLILYRIISPPDAGSFPGVSVDVSPSIGAFLGLIAAVGIAYGSYRAMQEEGTSFGEIGDNFSNRGGPGASTPPQQPPSATPPPPPPPPSSGQGGPPPQ